MVRETELNKKREPALYAEAMKLAPGEVSSVIRTEDSLHILKLLQYSPEKKADLSQIMGLVERRLRARKQQRKTAVWEDDLKRGAAIEILEERDR